MTPVELRAALSLAGIFGLRLAGMFIILPVFAIYAETLDGGRNLALVGFAIGAYGLTQAVLQIPFGWWSDRAGRKPVVYAGLAIFAAGSFIAAAATDIYIVILGRILQGAGAISAVVIAMTADLTRESQRLKAMAIIGSTIGLSFAASLVAGPWLARVIGVPGIFALTGVLALVAALVVWKIVPDAPRAAHPRPGQTLSDFAAVLANRELARLNWGIFALHAVLMALFIAVPFALRRSGLLLEQHWQVYLPVMLGSFVLMLPAVMGRDNPVHTRRWFIGSIALLLLSQIAMPWLMGGVPAIALFLLLFFVPFNILEAMLPSLTSRLAPVAARGTAIGLYSSIQFFGTFLGAAAGGYLYGRWGLHGVVVFCVALMAVWLVLAVGMRSPRTVAPGGAAD